MAGYNEGQYERVKEVAELVRRSTWYLWNIQVAAEDKAQTPADLWPMPWDKKESYEQGEMSEEDRKKLEEGQAEFLKNM